MGGFRVGVVDRITTPAVRAGARSPCSTCRLDKTVEPLPVDTGLTVRPRSALGLKYVEITPGGADKTITAGGHDPAGQRGQRHRAASRTSRTCSPPSTPRPARPRGSGLEGFGDAFAGPRGVAQRDDRLAQPLPARPHAGDGEPQRPDDRARPASSAASAATAGRWPRWLAQQAELFGNMADTFDAISRNPSGAAADDRRGPRDADHRDPLLPGAAALPGRLHRAVAAPAPRAQGAAALAAAAQPRVAWRAPTCCARGAPLTERPLGSRSASSRTSSRTRTPCWRSVTCAPLCTVARPGDRVRRALPDGLQLLQLLRPPARQAHVAGRRRRHGGAVQLKQADREQRTALTIRDNSRPGRTRADARPSPGRTRSAAPAHPYGSRPSTPTATPTARRPDRLPDRAAVGRATATGPASCGGMNVRHRPQTTSRSCRAAPTSRASWASTTSRTCPDGALLSKRRRPREGGMSPFKAGLITIAADRAGHVLRVHQDQPVRQPRTS